MTQFSRVEALIGTKALKQLQQTTVMVLGVGGVGSMAVEALVRSGVGNLIIVDYDNYEPSNLNRQWPSNHLTLNKPKTEVIKEQSLLINQQLHLKAINLKLDLNNYVSVILDNLSSNFFLLEALDDMRVKSSILALAYKQELSCISSMGAANITDISKIKIADFSKTSHCPVARVVRTQLFEQGIKKGVPVVYSTEDRAKPAPEVKGSLMTVTGAFGLHLASFVIEGIVKNTDI